MDSMPDTGLQCVSKSTQPHRFFERYLDNDLQKLTKELEHRYKLIEEAKVTGVTPVKENEIWKSSNSVSTMKWRQYNVFQFHIEEVYNLFLAISDMVKEACDYYDIDFEAEKFMIQGWFNINHAKKGKLDWHEHGPGGAPNFHGYYCVNAEPSITYYKAFDNFVENYNTNNRAILSEMGHPHAMGDWDWEGSRITIAYDVIPLRDIIRFGVDQEQHWIPLL